MKKSLFVAFMLLATVSLGFGEFIECIQNCKEIQCLKACDNNDTEECISDCKENNRNIESYCHHECIHEE